jgi:chemotaxis protein MotD
MIDLSALGLSSVQTSPHGGKRDKVDASQEHGKNAKSFGDLVDQAGKKGGSGNKGDEIALRGAADLETDDKQAAEAAAALKAGAGHGTDSIAMPKIGNASRNAASLKAEAGNPADASRSKHDSKSATDDAVKPKTGKSETVVAADGEAVDVDLLAGDAAKAETSQSEARLRPSAGARQLTNPGIARTALPQSADGKDEVKGDKAANKQALNAQKDDATAVKGKPVASPSEELQALLGMAPAKDEADADVAGKPVEKPLAKTSEHASDDNKTDAKPADDAVAAVGGAAASAAQAAAVQHPALKLPESAADRVDTGDKASADNDVDKLPLVSNGGKGRPTDVELAKRAGGNHAEPAGGGKTDFVTVLDSRRYLGFTPDSSNTVALTNAIKAEPSWAQVIHNVNTGAGHTATEVNTLKLQMNPEHLGNMTASLRLKGDELSVEVRVETVDAYRQLSKDQDSIVKALKDQGFSIDQVSIQLSPAARSDAGQGSGSQYQSGGGDQNLQQGGQGDTARQRDEGARRNSNQNNWMGNDTTSTFSDSGTGRSNTDTGNLYL